MAGTYKSPEANATSMTPIALKPSGDKTGVADYEAAVRALSQSRHAAFSPGEFVLSQPLELKGEGMSVTGCGDATVVRPFRNSLPVFVLNKTERASVKDVRILGGMHGIACDKAWRTTLGGVSIHATRSHGIVLANGSLITSVTSCRITSAGGCGIESSDLSDGNGNALSLNGTSIEWCQGHGLHWSGTGLGVFGCCIEGNKQSGIWLDGANVVTGGAAINGCYLEGNRRSQIRMNGVVSKGVHSVQVSGNYFLSHSEEPGILCDGERGEVRRLVVDPSNFFGSEEGSLFIDAGDACRHSRLHIKAMSRIRCLNPTDNTITHDGMAN